MRLERTRHEAGFFGKLRGRAAQAQRWIAFDTQPPILTEALWDSWS